MFVDLFKAVKVDEGIGRTCYADVELGSPPKNIIRFEVDMCIGPYSSIHRLQELFKDITAKH